MTNNDILRRIRYTFDFSDLKMIAIFTFADLVVTKDQISSWLKKEDDTGYELCNDLQLAIFLNGLINDRRGKKEGEQPKPEKRLTNNIILRKLKIALDLQADDILAIMDLANLRISKHELSAFFRKAGHKHYRECKDQILRNFLKGMQLKYRGDAPSEVGEKTPEENVSDKKTGGEKTPEKKTLEKKTLEKKTQDKIWGKSSKT